MKYRKEIGSEKLRGVDSWKSSFLKWIDEVSSKRFKKSIISFSTSAIGVATKLSWDRYSEIF